MTLTEYKDLELSIKEHGNTRLFEWELLKVLWEIRDALKGNLE